jgi:hypothetical protein
MPCKQARRNDPCDESKTVAVVQLTSKVRLVRAIVDNKSPDMDVREAPYNLRHQRPRSD